MSKSQIILYAVNFIFFVLGLALTSVAGILLSHHRELLDNVTVDGKNAGDYGQKVINAGTIVSLCTGIGLMVMGLLGCWAARNFDRGLAKCVLLMYSLLAFVTFVLALSGGIVEMVLTHELTTYSDAGSSDVKAADRELYDQLVKFSNQTYTRCCEGGKPMATLTKGCQLIQKGVLDQSGSCATPAAFRDTFFTYLANKLHPLAIFSVVLSVVSFFTLCASCCLVWRSREPAKRPLADAEAGRGQYYNAGSYAPPAAQTGSQVRYA